MGTRIRCQEKVCKNFMALAFIKDRKIFGSCFVNEQNMSPDAELKG
jgi:hypothetical protein